MNPPAAAMGSSLMFEGTNGAFFILAICSFFIIGYYTVKNADQGYTFLRPAIPFFIIFFGEMIQRGAYWYIRHAINQGQEVAVPYWLAISSSVIITTGFLCFIRVYSPQSWGNMSWLISLALTVAFVVASLNI